MTVLKPKRKVFVRRRPPEGGAFLAEAVARRARQAPLRTEADLAALIARRGGERGGNNEPERVR